MNKKDIYEILIEEKGFKFKKYREKWDKAGKGEIELDYPLHLNFELNFGCNLRCPACLHSLSFKDWPYKVDPNKNISFNKFCEIIDEGAKYGLCSIELNGINEPLLKNDIFKYIGYAYRKGVLLISMHTNGLLLTESISEKLIESGLSLIIFSIDAFTKETYSKIRIKGNYNRVISNVLRFLEIKKEKNKQFPLTKISFSVNKVNVHELPDFLNFWDDKVDFYSTSYFCNPFIGMSNYGKIEKKYRINNEIFFKCSEPNVRLLIQNNGNICPCCSFFAGEIIIGNIYENSIYDTWNSCEMRELRLKIRQNKMVICDKCLRSLNRLTNDKY